MILCIDIGNTKIKFALFNINKIVPIKLFNIKNNLIININNCNEVLTYQFKHNNIILKDIKSIVIASVVDNLENMINLSMHKIFKQLNKNIKIIKCNSKTAKNINKKIYNCKYANPNEVGSDIICGAIGCKHKFGEKSVLFDFGTATKAIIIDKKGCFIGSIIWPGIQSSFKAIEKDTSAINNLKIKFPPSLIGKNTEECIQNGIVFGSSLLVTSFLKQIEKELGYKLKIVLTGGLCEEVAKGIKENYYIDKNLIMHGLRIFYENYDTLN